MIRINADVPDDFEEYCEFVGLKEKEIFLFFNSLCFSLFLLPCQSLKYLFLDNTKSEQ